MLSDSSGNGGGFVFDCRSLPNPGRYEAFKYLTGKDAPVISFLEARQEVQDFIDQSFQVVMPSIENYLSRGFEHLMVGFGCTGGQHRSVFCAEKFAEAIRQKYALSVTVKHYQQDQENNNSGKKS
jgi:RNase adaptor protein for sRNA GlmZ degradation